MKPEFRKYFHTICALLSLYNTASAFNTFCDSPSFYKFICFGSSISVLGLMLFNLLPYYDTGKKEDQIIANEHILPGQIICLASIATCNILGGVCWIAGCAT